MKRTVPGLLLEIAQEILLCVCVGVSVRERECVCGCGGPECLDTGWPLYIYS